MSPPNRGRFLTAVAGAAAVAWLALVAAGFAAIERYESTPGAADRSPAGWPAGSALVPAAGRPNAVMAVHPRCPCTRASLAILGEILARVPGGPSVRLLVYRPGGAGGSGPEWSAVAPAGASVVDDPGGLEASRFGLATSGAIAAFDAKGRRKFAGGLTAGRGREAISGGGEALLAVLAGREPIGGLAPVFGCGLRGAPRGTAP